MKPIANAAGRALRAVALTGVTAGCHERTITLESPGPGTHSTHRKGRQLMPTFALVRRLARLVVIWLATIALGCTPRGGRPSNVAAFAPGSPAVSRTLLLRQDLPNLPGWETRLYLIEYPPGVAAPIHHHPVEGLGYVVSGSFESAFEGEPATVVSTGQSFRERAQVPHVLFRNTDEQRPLRFVIAFVVARGAPVVVTP